MIQIVYKTDIKSISNFAQAASFAVKNRSKIYFLHNDKKCPMDSNLPLSSSLGQNSIEGATYLDINIR